MVSNVVFCACVYCVTVKTIYYGKCRVVMRNKPGDWSQSEMAKYFE